MKIKCFTLVAALAPILAEAITLPSESHLGEHPELTLAQTSAEELFHNIKRLTPTYEYELPALGPDYAGRPLGALMDLDAILHPEKITEQNKKTVCKLARTLGLVDKVPEKHKMEQLSDLA